MGRQFHKETFNPSLFAPTQLLTALLSAQSTWNLSANYKFLFLSKSNLYITEANRNKDISSFSVRILFFTLFPCWREISGILVY